MSQRPPDVRITDFDAPESSPEVQQMIDGVAPLAAAIPWTLEAAMAQAAWDVATEGAEVTDKVLEKIEEILDRRSLSNAGA